MNEFQRLQYLAAMGIELWLRRDVPDAASGAASVQEALTLVVDGSPPPASGEPLTVAAAPEEPGAALVPSPAPRGQATPSEGTEPAIAEVSEPLVPDVATLDWPGLEQAVAACTACPLHAGRTQTVFGVGARSADWMIVGEAPGAEEDRQGAPFVGPAGQLLDAMLRAIGLGRDRVFIANVLKCRPPNNRDPQPAEVACCERFLERQIALVRPRVLLAVGRVAAQHLLKTDANTGQLRGRRHSFGEQNIPLVVTYHPAYLLRSPLEKRKAWQDLQLARELFEGGA